MREKIQAEVLVVGGGTGGTAAALQAARRGAKTVLVSEFAWLGGMLTSAGVSAPDGNELIAFQSGIWAAFLTALSRQQPGGLDHGWVSFFTYEPALGAQIFREWVAQLPNLHWIWGQTPRALIRQGEQVMGVEFDRVTVHAWVTLDGTELGDLLALGNVPYRWGWEDQGEFQEPSAPLGPAQTPPLYPVQAPTWVVVLRDWGAREMAAAIPPAPGFDEALFQGAWAGHGAEAFLNYGRLPGGQFMINWPICGNDYGTGLDRLVSADRHTFLQECLWHSQNFAHWIQSQLGRRYGLAENSFPSSRPGLGGGAYGLHPYYRESRRLQGLSTLTEQDLLPGPGHQAAPLAAATIGLGNYVNDHHYPGLTWPLASKTLRWGGRATGTPFTVPYYCLVPAAVDGLLVCEKNISVTHIANGATRLQPVVLGIGQAAGMAAALCVENRCQPRQLSVRQLQLALVQEPTAPAALVPLFNCPPQHPDWSTWQMYYLDHPEVYPGDGNAPCAPSLPQGGGLSFKGQFCRRGEQDYALVSPGQTLKLVTLDPAVHQALLTYGDGETMAGWGRINRSGNWLLVTALA